MKSAADPNASQSRLTKFWPRFFQDLLNSKYHPYFPLYFSLSKRLVSVNNTHTQKLQGLLKKGDILLRRHKNYLDGVILAQTSYYTHAAIYRGLNDQQQQEVIHAISFQGVSPQNLEEFCHGGEYVVLRFYANKDKFDENLRLVNASGILSMDKETDVNDGGALPWKKVEVVGKKDSPSNASDIRTFIKDDKTNRRLYDEQTINAPAQTADDLALANEEGILYDDLVAMRTSADKLDVDHAIDLATRQAVKCLGEPYDHDFDFIDPKKFCCVELVWYCYKALAPLLRIQREEMTYCGFIKVSVIVPDMFLKNPFFKVVYPEKNDDKTLLIKTAHKERFKLWPFLAILILYNVVLYVACSGILIFFCWLVSRR